MLEGDWEGSIQLLGELGIFDDDTRREATFYIYQQKFLEVSLGLAISAPDSLAQARKPHPGAK